MKKFLSVLLSLICVLSLSLNVMAEETLHYTFDGEDSLTVVTNTLAAGGSASINDGALALNGTYGLKLGDVGTTFTVSAMVEITSTGGTNTIFFKDMDNVGNKWTGVISNGKKPAFWTHGGGFAWTTVASGSQDLGNLSYVTYVENNGVGTLYVNGEKVGSGNVCQGAGTLYLGATYWSADALSGTIDNVKLYNSALTQAEVMAAYEEYVDFENAIELPNEVIGDISLPGKIASKTVTWATSDSSVITTGGKVTRHSTDKTVTLTASIDGNVLKEFEVTVLKKPVIVNSEVILSYKFGSDDGEIIHDVSGNGNHGAAYNGLVIDKDGAVFDGSDDYVKMPEGVLYGHDDITITMTMKPNGAQKHVFAYGFGNTADTGYMFLNPSRPDTNYIRFAATKQNYLSEREVVSLPGIRSGEWATVTMVLSGSGNAYMYVDGDLVMDGELKMTVSSLGETTQNYIAKSLYEGDPYFAGTVSEFTVYNYCMSESEIKQLYGKTVEYAPETVAEDYITSVSFEDGIDVELDTFGRDDVKIGVVVLDEHSEVIEVQVVSSSDEIRLEKEGTICVFAFNEEDNIPGTLYVKGTGEGFDFEYTPGKVVLVSEESYENGTVIIAGYDIAGTLTGVAIKKADLTQGTPEELNGEFDNAVNFKMLYWENLVSMIPVE
ncbi:MAG: LamG domain-containing protein [Clostridia bacterium]|nr:LamG domain-containing protein [Clostridia bacterium]